MKSIVVQNVNHALHEGFWHLKIEGKKAESRNGPVIVSPTPVVTTYAYPMERVLFQPERDANPVFHLMEAIWMLAGRNGLAFLEPFNSGFKRYAEDDGGVHGAYGWRWRGGSITHKDQILYVIDLLRRDNDTRRAVIQMWDADMDLGENKRDLPCNTTIYFNVEPRGALDMTVCCRSNDILWGAYGANAVHMSILHEVVARGAGLDIGTYYQFSNNYHAYTDLPLVAKFLDVPPDVYDPYSEAVPNRVFPLPLFEHDNAQVFLEDCEAFCRYDRVEHPFLQYAAILRDAYLARKEGKPLNRSLIPTHWDWGRAFLEWVDRREARE